MVKPQEIELNKRGSIFSNDRSPIKRLYVEDRKINFNLKDVILLISKLRNVYKMPFTLKETEKLIKSDYPRNQKVISNNSFNELKKLIQHLDVDDYGYFEITPERVFKGCAVPYKYALVFSSRMNFDSFKEAPNLLCQLEVARVYSITGDIANKVSLFLQDKGFGASPNHSMGGQVDYSMAAEWAGIAVTGRHSMAMTRKNGSCHRISVVYTDIENLGDYISNRNDDMLWIREFCQKCGKCIRTCPTGAILNEPILYDGFNPSKIDYQKCCEGFMNYGCGVCIKECPFSKGRYEELKQAFMKINHR